MKVRLSLDVDAYTRYVIARYFRLPYETTSKKRRVRATRAQVRRFVLAALRTSVHEQAGELDAMGRTIAAKLMTPIDDGPGIEFLAEPREKQRNLPLNVSVERSVS